MELLDVYDSNGNVTGRKIIRGDKTAVLDENEHIAVAVIFIENDNGEFLIQRTSQEKGGEFSSTGGHVDSGETPMEALDKLVIQEDEVAYVEYMSVPKINELIESDQMLKSHGIMFNELMAKRKILKK